MTVLEPRFRLVETRDYDALCRLFRDPDELFLTLPSAKAPFDMTQLRRLLHERRDPTVMEMDDEVAGFGSFYNVVPGRSAWIGNLVVAPRWRGMGLGRELLGYLCAVLRHQGIPLARLSVFADNLPALRLYHQSDFVPYGMEERVDPEGRVHVLLHLQRMLTGDVKA